MFVPAAVFCSGTRCFRISAMSDCLIGLGSNLGDRVALLTEAVASLSQHADIRVIATSQWHATRPIGGPAGQGAFLNGVCRLSTSLSPTKLWQVITDIEQQLGRRRGERWGPRTVDLDLLLYGDLVVDEASLRVPHPRMAMRRFVLAPAVEVAADMVHPEIGWGLERLWNHLQSSPQYVAIAGPPGTDKSALAERLASHYGFSLASIPEDPRLLTDFYADTTGRGLATELEFLQQRREILLDTAVGSTATANTDQSPVVSDFWLDQSLAYSRLWLTEADQLKFDGRWRDARAEVVTPRIVVLLDADSQVPLERIMRRGRPYETQLTLSWLERLREELMWQTRQPDVGPVLRLPGKTDQDAWVEVSAAIEAVGMGNSGE